MSREAAFIEALRKLVTHPAARGLADDAAVLDIGGTHLVLTHDTLVEGVHFLSTDPPETIGWKLVAVNMSDLAAKGATPLAALMSYTLGGEAAWDAAFLEGLSAALDTFGVALIGGDTVASPYRASGCASFGLTAIGTAGGRVPGRDGAQVGDALFVTGTIGDAGLGLDIVRERPQDTGPLVEAYRQPMPQLAAGQLLAPVVSAMMDVSDGLLIDAQRLAAASGVGLMIDLDAVPLSAEFRASYGEDRFARMEAATAGDDYQLLFSAALPPPKLPCPVTRIGRIVRGEGLSLHDGAGDVTLPARLGWEH
jgi:thiamine-monophosphate kinase